MYERKCKNWLQTFGEWTMPRSEAPETFIFWTGLFNIAAALRRHVQIPKSLLGSWGASPNIYVMFIAPPGKARKSTTVNYIEELLENVPDITRSPEMITKESLMSTLVKSPDASMYIVAPEFGEFIVKSGPEMFGFLTNAYDGKKRLDVSTHVRSLELAEKPCINLIGATTPKWVAENMPESVIGGGYASRVIFIFEKKARARELFYDHLDQDKLGKLHEDLVADLCHIGLNLYGDFSFTPDAHTYLSEWYKTIGYEEEENQDNEKLQGYFSRKPAHILKLSMLLHVAYSDELVINLGDIEYAMKVLEQVEMRLPAVFNSIGKNPYTADVRQIYEFITKRGKVYEKDIKRAFFHVALPERLNELVVSLLESGYIKLNVDPERGERFFTPILSRENET